MPKSANESKLAAGGFGDQSRVFRLSEMPAHTAPNGSESCNAGHGALVTGEVVAIHESTQPAGATPNPAHEIQHTEFICIREGTLEFVHDGRTERASAGDILLVAKGTFHGLRNVGDGPVSYFVAAIGGDVKA